MDLITQGLTGAVLATSVARTADVRRAAVIGAVAGMLPDADILIRAADDPLFNIEYHRHFSHSLLFVPFGALLAALLLWPFMRGKLRFAQVYLFAVLGLLTAGLLDACTSFGTHLLWPFSDERIAWNLIAIVDPLFSLALIVALVFALRRKSATPARFGIGFAALYLLLALTQHERAEALMIEFTRNQGHAIERLEVKPTLGNIVLWRGVYLAGDQFHVAAIRTAWFSEPRAYPGGSIPRFHAGHGLPSDSVQARDIERFAQLSDDYLVRHPQRADVIGDVRYSMLPNSTAPLWGIVIDPAAPDRHVQFITLREMNPAMRRDFVSMLLGRPLDAAQ